MAKEKTGGGDDVAADNTQVTTPSADDLRDFDTLAAEAGTPVWLVEATRAKFRFPRGTRLTPEKYAECVDAALNEPIGGR